MLWNAAHAAGQPRSGRAVAKQRNAMHATHACCCKQASTHGELHEPLSGVYICIPHSPMHGAAHFLYPFAAALVAVTHDAAATPPTRSSAPSCVPCCGQPRRVPRPATRAGTMARISWQRERQGQKIEGLLAAGWLGCAPCRAVLRCAQYPYPASSTTSCLCGLSAACCRCPSVGRTTWMDRQRGGSSGELGGGVQRGFGRVEIKFEVGGGSLGGRWWWCHRCGSPARGNRGGGLSPHPASQPPPTNPQSP